MTKERSKYWDTLKGFLIILVVLGHTGTSLGDKLLSVIYSFHMPLFVYVSGYFSKKKEHYEWMMSTIKLLGIYLIFHVAYILFDYFTGVNIGLNRILSPSFALWYILSLVFWRLIPQFVSEKVLGEKELVMTLSVILAMVSGFIPFGTQMSFQRTFVFLPFFLAGFYSHKCNWVEKLRKLNKIPFGILLIVLLTIAYLWMPVFYANSYYQDITGLGLRFVELIIATLICVSILNLMPESIGQLNTLGMCTMSIYLLHPPIIKFSKMALQHLGINVGVLWAVVITTISILFIYLFN